MSGKVKVGKMVVLCLVLEGKPRLENVPLVSKEEDPLTFNKEWMQYAMCCIAFAVQPSNREPLLIFLPYPFAVQLSRLFVVWITGNIHQTRIYPSGYLSKC